MILNPQGLRDAAAGAMPAAALHFASAVAFGVLPVLVALAGSPAQAAGTGLVYVSSEKDNAMTMLDAKTHAVTGTIATCKRPRHMQLTPDRERLVVTCSDSDRADLIDLKTRKTVDSVPLGEDPKSSTSVRTAS